MKKNEWLHLGLLVLTAFIWGMAFVAQSIGADSIGPVTFLALRSWLGVLALSPLILRTLKKFPLDQKSGKQLLKGGIICGIFLFSASLFQQIGIADTTTAKSGFITALYMLIVPLFSIFLGHKPNGQTWISIVIGVVGLYLLCIHGSITNITKGDTYTFICAILFAGQILAVNHFVEHCHPILLSGIQFLTCAVFGTIGMFFEPMTLQNVSNALIPLLYAGIFSTGVAYTLQMVGQKDLNPSIASLAMCLESVFSALGGWVILGQELSSIELAGCFLMFLAIVFSQVSFQRVNETETK
jgi:drug/metabolite transporter (DMT)-like permease